MTNEQLIAMLMPLLWQARRVNSRLREPSIQVQTGRPMSEEHIKSVADAGLYLHDLMDDLENMVGILRGDPIHLAFDDPEPSFGR